MQWSDSTATFVVNCYTKFTKGTVLIDPMKCFINNFMLRFNCKMVTVFCKVILQRNTKWQD